MSNIAVKYFMSILIGIGLFAQTTPPPPPIDGGYIVIEGTLEFDPNNLPIRFPFQLLLADRSLKPFAQKPDASNTYTLQYTTISGKIYRGPISFYELSDGKDSKPSLWNARIPTLESGVKFDVYKDDELIYTETVSSPVAESGLEIEEISPGTFRISPDDVRSIDIFEDGDVDWRNYGRYGFIKNGIFTLPKRMLDSKKPTWLSIELWRGFRRDVIFYRWDPNATNNP